MNRAQRSIAAAWAHSYVPRSASRWQPSRGSLGMAEQPAVLGRGTSPIDARVFGS